MTLVSDVLASCRNDYLLSGTREARNRLSNTVDPTTDTWTLDFDVANIQNGSKLSIDLEDVSVWDSNQSANTVTVQRGDLGSTAMGHAGGTVVTVNPQVSDAGVFRAVNSELGALSSRQNGLFQMNHLDVSYNASLDGYDLTGAAPILSIYEVRYKSTGPELEWPVVVDWEYQRDSSTSDFPSGQVIFIRSYAQPGFPIRVWYRTPYTPLTASTDDVLAVSGLHTEAHDILAVGAAIRLTVGRETTRNISVTQGDTRRAMEVPAGANVGASRALQAWRAQRVGEEAARLAALWPVKYRSL